MELMKLSLLPERTAGLESMASRTAAVISEAGAFARRSDFTSTDGPEKRHDRSRPSAVSLIRLQEEQKPWLIAGMKPIRTDELVR